MADIAAGRVVDLDTALNDPNLCASQFLAGS
jgi:hypothetical protein